MVLSVARDTLAATTVGNYALFGGGYGSSPTYKDTVDAYVDNACAKIRAYLVIANRKANYKITDLIDGTIFNISNFLGDFLTLKRGHAYRFSDASEETVGLTITKIEAGIMRESGFTGYEYRGAIGYGADTIYIAPNISVPTDASDPDDPLILLIEVYFSS